MEFLFKYREDFMIRISREMNGIALDLTDEISVYEMEVRFGW